MQEKNNQRSKKIYEARIRRSKFYENNNSIISNNNAKIKKRNLKSFPSMWNKSIFLTGGIGDIIAVESFLTDSEKNSIETIYYATRQFNFIKEIIQTSCIFPSLKKNINLWNENNNFWCFFSVEDFLKRSKNLNSKINLGIKNSKDLSILVFFEKIKKNEIKYNKSSFLYKNFYCIKRFKLPKKYVTVCPYSTDKRNKTRDFNKSDWSNTLKFCEKNNIDCVVINKGEGYVPNNNKIINLTNKTKILEAIEILKKSVGYFGIDSWLSVLAAKLFDNDLLKIKSDNEHLLNNLYCYYAPKKEFDFINKNIEF